MWLMGDKGLMVENVADAGSDVREERETVQKKEEEREGGWDPV